MSGIPPSGHARAALAFALGAVFFAYAFVLRVAPSVMVTELMTAFGVGAAVLGNLSAFYFYAYAGLQIPVGLLLDRFGPRRLMSLAALVVGAGTLLFGMAGSIEHAYLGRLLIGAGCAFSWAGTLAIVNQWFPSRFALLAGVSQTVAMGGAVLGQAPLAAVIARSDWRTTMIALAAVAALLAVLVFVVTRDRPSPGRAGDESPGARGVLRNPQTWLAAWFGLTMTAPLLAFGGLWGVPWLAATHEAGLTRAAAIVSLIFVGNGVGGLTVGWLSDRLRRRRAPMLAWATLSIAAQIAFLSLPTLPLPAVAALVFLAGFGGGAMVLAFAVAREHNPMRRAGLTVGVINTAVVGSGALLQPLIGWLLDLQWDGTMIAGARQYAPDAYTRALLVVPGLGLLGLAALAAIAETGARQRVD